jgi:hypothetical protein
MMRPLLLMLLAAGFIAFPLFANAEDKQAAEMQKTEVAGAAEKGVIVYGQTLYPGRVSLPHSGYTWKELEYLLPQILPEARNSNLTAAETCQHIMQLSQMYLNEVDKASNYLAYKLGPVFPDQDTDFLLSEKLTSKAPQDFSQLLLALPNDQARIITAKDVTLKSLALLLLQDAAIANCPDYAKEKGIGGYTIPYPGPGAGAASPPEKSDTPEIPSQERPVE